MNPGDPSATPPAPTPAPSVNEDRMLLLKALRDLGPFLTACVHTVDDYIPPADCPKCQALRQRAALIKATEATHG